MSSSSNTQGDDTTSKAWYQHVPSWKKNHDIQKTPLWRQKYDAITTLIYMGMLLLAAVLALVLNQWSTAGWLILWLIVILIVLDRVENWILNPLQERGFDAIINDQASKVNSKVNPPKERPAPEKASAPIANPDTKPIQQDPVPAQSGKGNTAQQPSSRPGKGKARGAQSGSGATPHQARPAQTPASSQSSEPRSAGFYSMGKGAIAPEKLS
ncbi:hypothetical protein I8H83_02735 [Candidatus Saccharibacteria bacterium]|nr:hypothetical protein [Candidatus Saccharibacteria bacterium]